MQHTQPLAAGDHVQVTMRTGSGVEHWFGVVLDVDHKRRTARINGHRRSITVALKGAQFVRSLAEGEAWEAFVDAHSWTTPPPFRRPPPADRHQLPDTSCLTPAA
ncbi:hypothetical protein [Paenarthrobacter sp. C1]|uniref:hypothetical protein n=1 Tax=Paenarthrobacter sp. C1 TaxID=3400220 RepID=UPI003BF4DE6F